MRIGIRGDEVRVAAGGSSLRLTPDGVVYRKRNTTARASWWTTRQWSWSDVVLIHAGSSHPTRFVPVLTLFDAAGRAVVLLPTRAPKVADARRLADALAPFELLHRTQFDLAMFRSETWAPRGPQEGLTVRWWSGKHRPTPDHQSPGVIELSSGVRLVRVVAPIAAVVVFFGGFVVRCAVDGARRNQATTRAVQEVASGEWVPVACREWALPASWNAAVPIDTITVTVAGSPVLTARALGSARRWPSGGTLAGVLAATGWIQTVIPTTEDGPAEVTLHGGDTTLTSPC